MATAGGICSEDLHLSGIVDKRSTNFRPGTPCFAVVFPHDASGRAQPAQVQVPRTQLLTRANLIITRCLIVPEEEPQISALHSV